MRALALAVLLCGCFTGQGNNAQPRPEDPSVQAGGAAPRERVQTRWLCRCEVRWLRDPPRYETVTIEGVSDQTEAEQMAEERLERPVFGTDSLPRADCECG